MTLTFEDLVLLKLISITCLVMGNSESVWKVTSDDVVTSSQQQTEYFGRNLDEQGKADSWPALGPMLPDNYQWTSNWWQTDGVWSELRSETGCLHCNVYMMTGAWSPHVTRIRHRDNNVYANLMPLKEKRIAESLHHLDISYIKWFLNFFSRY